MSRVPTSRDSLSYEPEVPGEVSNLLFTVGLNKYCWMTTAVYRHEIVHKLACTNRPAYSPCGRELGRSNQGLF